MLKRFARFIPVIAAAAAVALALAILSRVMVTVDTISQPELRLVYLGAVALLLGGLGLFAWMRLRPRRKTDAPRQLPYHRRLSPEDRLGALYERHRLDRIEPAPPRSAAKGAAMREPGRLRVAIAGVAGTGKTALAGALRAAAADGRHDALAVEIVEIAALGTHLGRNLDRLTPALSADLTLFVVDQDLRDYEQDAITALARRQAELLVVLNKSDLLRPMALSETVAAIAAKLATASVTADIVTTAAAPRPAVRLAEADDGQSVGEPGSAGEQEQTRPAEVAAILSHFETFAARRGRSGVHVLPGLG